MSIDKVIFADLAITQTASKLTLPVEAARDIQLLAYKQAALGFARLWGMQKRSPAREEQGFPLCGTAAVAV